MSLTLCRPPSITAQPALPMTIQIFISHALANWKSLCTANNSSAKCWIIKHWNYFNSWRHQHVYYYAHCAYQRIRSQWTQQYSGALIGDNCSLTTHFVLHMSQEINNTESISKFLVLDNWYIDLSTKMEYFRQRDLQVPVKKLN
jgi:hypothetical protein